MRYTLKIGRNVWNLREKNHVIPFLAGKNSDLSPISGVLERGDFICVICAENFDPDLFAAEMAAFIYCVGAVLGVGYSIEKEVINGKSL